MKTLSLIGASVALLTTASCSTEHRDTEIVCTATPLDPQAAIVVNFSDMPDGIDDAITSRLRNPLVVRSESEFSAINESDATLFGFSSDAVSTIDFSKHNVLICYWFINAIPDQSRFFLRYFVDDNRYQLSSHYSYRSSEELPENQMALVRSAVVTDIIPVDSEVSFQYSVSASDIWD